MEAWLRCTLLLGQFNWELAVVVRTSEGKTFSLFAQKEDLRCEELPVGEGAVKGWIQVMVVQQDGDLFLVRLPQSTLENGQYLTVSADHLDGLPAAEQE